MMVELNVQVNVIVLCLCNGKPCETRIPPDALVKQLAREMQQGRQTTPPEPSGRDASVGDGLFFMWN